MSVETALPVSVSDLDLRGGVVGGDTHTHTWPSRTPHSRSCASTNAFRAGLLAAHNLTETSSINAAVEAWSQAARNVAPKHCFMDSGSLIRKSQIYKEHLKEQGIAVKWFPLTPMFSPREKKKERKQTTQGRDGRTARRHHTGNSPREKLQLVAAEFFSSRVLVDNTRRAEG